MPHEASEHAEAEEERAARRPASDVARLAPAAAVVSDDLDGMHRGAGAEAAGAPGRAGVSSVMLLAEWAKVAAGPIARADGGKPEGGERSGGLAVRWLVADAGGGGATPHSAASASDHAATPDGWIRASMLCSAARAVARTAAEL